MEKIKNLSFNRVILPILFILSFIVVYLQNKGMTFFTIFMQRDLLRAAQWLQGNPYWWGPEMSAGGNLPGPFLYFLLIPPVLFSENIYTNSIIWNYLWIALTYSTLFYFLHQICKHKRYFLIFSLIYIMISNFFIHNMAFLLIMRHLLFCFTLWP